MSELTESAGMLLQLAAEGMATVVPGCAQAVAAAGEPVRSPTPDAAPLRAINYFGPHIVERWLSSLNAKSKNEQSEIIAQLASLPAADLHHKATECIERVAAGASLEDKSLATDYLAAIPLTVRRALVQDPDTDRLTLPTVLAHPDSQTLIRLLPTDVPPFSIGCEVPGTTYQLEELLGIGGFGAVYKAKNRCEQHQPPRAIKFCLDPSMVVTLHHERAILDRLMTVDGAEWSDRIVRLYGYALEAQPPFLVYEYVPGGDLTNYLRSVRQKTGRGLRPETAMEVIRQVTEALAFAHAQGLVHRDLKPANVLLSDALVVKLTDFGIGGVVATHAARGPTLLAGSLTGHLTAADQAGLFRGSGTPLYMSPEQRRGDQPDPRHDLYSLGVLWYQLLVGDVSRELHPGWPDELLEEYQTPKEQTELIQRCVGYFKKRPLHAGELLSLLPSSAQERPAATTVAVAAPSVPSAPPPSSAASTAIIDIRNADAHFEKLKLTLADQIERDDLAQARDTVASMLRLRPHDPEALEVRAFINQRFAIPVTELHVFTEHKGWVRSVAVLPDGKHALSASDDQTVRLWDLQGRRCMCVFQGHTAAVMCVAVAPNGSRQALSGSWDGSVRLWDIDAGKEIRRITGAWKTVKCAAFSPSGARFVFGSDDHKLHLYEKESGREIRVLEGHTDLIQGVSFAPDGKRVASCGDDGFVRVWDLEGGREICRIAGHTDTVTSVAFAPNGRWVLSGSSDRSARLWDAQTGKELRRFDGHTNWVNCVAFSPRDLRILTGSGGEIVNGKFQNGADTTVRVWDLQSEQELCCFDKHQASVTSAVFAPSGRLILSGSLDKTVRLLMMTR